MSLTRLGPKLTAVRPQFGSAPARVLVVLVLGLVALLVMVLLVGSLVPGATLAGRLPGSSSSARAGTYTQDLVTYLDQRMRLAAALLLVLWIGLAVLRRYLQDLLRNLVEDLARGMRWPPLADLVPVGVLSVLAIGVRIPFMSQPMRYDEALSYNEFASRPLYYALSFYPDPNNHLLNTLLVHLTSAAMGSAPWVLRLPAFVAGVLLVPATYALAHVLFDRRAAVMASALVAVSSYVVEYSTNSRGYTLQALCFVVTLCLAVVAARRDSPTALLLASLVAALGAYALPTMFYGGAIVAAWFVLESRHAKLSRITRGHLVVSGLLLGLVVTLAYLPVVLVSGADKLVFNRFVVPLDLAQLTTELPVSLARTWGFWNRDLSVVVSALLVVGFWIACVAEARHGRTPIGLLAPGVCLVIVLVQRVAPFERVWLFGLPVYFAVAGGGLSRLLAVRRLPSYSAAVVGGVLAAVVAYATLNSGSILSSPETGAFPDAQAATRTLQQLLGPEDAVVTSVPASLPELQFYFGRAGMRIDSLVRPPAEARSVYVIAPPGVSPSVAGWGAPREIERFSGSALLLLSRT
ncbi:MAG: glycosyltransferase family 39 protein [Chloroflexota bacterium]|nr:glycosyltransferase family 39 protein [Chloroflexota bacterium]